MNVKVLIVLLFVPAVFAAPSIQNPSIIPENAFLGENVQLSFACVSALPITDVHASISGPDVIIPRVQLSGGPYYSINLDSAYIDRTGFFNVTLFCADSDGSTNTTLGLNVTQVSGTIAEILSSPLYMNELASINFNAEQDGSPVTDAINFSLFYDDRQQDIKSVAYDTKKGWILRAAAPSAEGVVNIKVYAVFGRANVSAQASANVRNPVGFSVTADKTSVTAGDNVTLSVSADYKGDAIPIGSNFLVYLNSNQLNAALTSGANTYAKISMPDVTPATYTLTAVMNYGNTNYRYSIPIYYMVPVKGQFLNGGKPVSTQIIFLGNGSQKLSVYTDASGNYSANIVPDVYDIKYVFPESTLTLRNVTFQQFTDPVFYSYSAGVKIPGFVTRAIYMYNTTLSYYSALIEIPYGDIDDSNLSLFRCAYADKSCSSWSDAYAGIDKNANKVTLTTQQLGAFALATRDALGVSFGLDKKSYMVNETLHISGTVQDSSRAQVGSARIDVRIGNDVIGNITTDDSGIFSLDMPSPQIEGNYTVTITARKYPYADGSASSLFEVQRLREISALFAQTVRISPGENKSAALMMTNTGQDGFSGMSISVDGIPENYFILDKGMFDLPVGADKNEEIIFLARPDADSDTFAGTIRIVSGSYEKDVPFGLTITEESAGQNAAAAAPGSLITTFVLSTPSLDVNYFYLLVFAVISISVAVSLKKIRKRSSGHETDNSFLFDLKSHMKSLESRSKKERG